MTVESSYHSANPEIQTLTEQSKNYSKQIMTIVDEVQKVIVGQEEVIKKLVIAMMAADLFSKALIILRGL